MEPGHQAHFGVSYYGNLKFLIGCGSFGSRSLFKNYTDRQILSHSDILEGTELSASQYSCNAHINRTAHAASLVDGCSIKRSIRSRCDDVKLRNLMHLSNAMRATTGRSRTDQTRPSGDRTAALRRDQLAVADRCLIFERVGERSVPAISNRDRLGL